MKIKIEILIQIYNTKVANQKRKTKLTSDFQTNKYFRKVIYLYFS